jgi:hypothetical protein
MPYLGLDNTQRVPVILLTSLREETVCDGTRMAELSNVQLFSREQSSLNSPVVVKALSHQGMN